MPEFIQGTLGYIPAAKPPIHYPATLTALTAKDAGASMQVVANQMIDEFHSDDMKLKWQVFVPNEMAGAHLRGLLSSA